MTTSYARRLLAITLALAVGTMPFLGIAGCAVQDGGDSSDGLHKTAPDVVGMALDEATRAIEEAGYEVGAVIDQSGEVASSGEVVSQDPVAGTSLPRDEEIDLTVGN